MTTDYHALIGILAARFGLDADVLEAQVIVESSGHADAFRFEAGIWSQLQRGALKPAVQIDLSRAVPRRVASSYGLLQVLYVTALDYGYDDVPEGLFVPEVGLAMGCTHLKALLTRAGGDLDSALATYNGGAAGNGPAVHTKRNQAYVDRVHRELAAIQKGTTVI